jgi:alpha-amylase
MIPTHLPQAIGGRVVAVIALLSFALPAPAQVLFQQFYYPIDQPANGMSWWQQATNELPALSKLGVYAIWHPVPVKGGSGGFSMGYDPYDLYDLGSKDQKGTVATHFGTKEDYLAYIVAAHANGLRVIADVVLNHTGGADFAESNPIMERLGWDDIPDDSKVPLANRPPEARTGNVNLRSWTRFTPKGADGKPGSGRFPRDYRHFHPSAYHPDRNPPYHQMEFGPDYCQEGENHYVWNNLCDWGLWFRAQTGVDGFRLDAVKLIDPPFLDDFAARVSHNATQSGTPFYLVGEYWDTNHGTLTDFLRATHRQMRLFDFALFYALWDMTDHPQTFDMRDLWIRRMADRDHAVMFVSNHDVDRFQPIKRERRILPYALIMTLAGQPSVFYLDYFRAEDNRLPKALEALIPVHNRFAIGKEILRFADSTVLAVERQGNLLGVFDDGGDDKARTLTLPTSFGPNVALRSVGQLPGASPVRATTDSTGSVRVTVAPGGYTLLVRADANAVTNPDRFPHTPLHTTQTFEFADDLDTGRLGATPRTIPLTLRAGSTVTIRLRDTIGLGAITMAIEDPSGTIVSKATGKRGTPLLLQTHITQGGHYNITVTAPGEPTNAHLQIDY